MTTSEGRRSAASTRPAIPARWYWDPAVFEQELDAVFGAAWQVACSADDVLRPGDRATARIGRVPIVVVRDDAGDLHGFVNVCRHRGHPVVSEDGNARLLQCPYHGWSYGLDGRLRDAPRCGLRSGGDTPNLALHRLAVSERHGLVWAHPDPAATPLTESHAPLDALLSRKGIDPSTYEFVQRSSITVKANWKLWVENAAECYHCPSVHRHTFADAWDVSEEAFELVEEGPVMAHFAGVRNGSRRFDGERNRFAYIYVFPGTFFTIDKSLLIAGAIVPLSNTVCEVVSLSHLSHDADPDDLNRWMEMYKRTLDEDVAVIERQRDGLVSRALDHGYLLTPSESGVLHFHDLLRAALEAGGPTGGSIRPGAGPGPQSIPPAEMDRATV